jgi:quercetin dioxygenase-like cupin family protein
VKGEIMPTLIKNPSIIEAVGNKPKIIKEFIGRVNSGTEQISIAKMTSPPGWIEPGQKPEFDEYTFVLKGLLRVETKDTVVDVSEGQAIIIEKNEWIRYSTPTEEGAEYIAVCLPAFSPETVHRDENMV